MDNPVIIGTIVIIAIIVIFVVVMFASKSSQPQTQTIPNTQPEVQTTPSPPPASSQPLSQTPTVISPTPQQTPQYPQPIAQQTQRYTPPESYPMPLQTSLYDQPNKTNPLLPTRPTQPTQPIPTATTQPVQPIPTATTQPASGSTPDESAMWVSGHNSVRAAVGQAPVTWNATIAAGAQAYANQCVFQHSDQSTRTLNGQMLGENLYWSSSSTTPDNNAITSWAAEKQYYTYPQGPSQSTTGETGHYTQMINKNVTQIGCGCSPACSDGSKICVCRYNPIQLSGQPPY